MYNTMLVASSDKRKPSHETQFILFILTSSLHSAALYDPYATWPIGLFSSPKPGAMKSVNGLPVALAAEQRAIVGELDDVLVCYID
jgi:hypothetical protein